MCRKKGSAGFVLKRLKKNYQGGLKVENFLDEVRRELILEKRYYEMLAEFQKVDEEKYSTYEEYLEKERKKEIIESKYPDLEEFTKEYEKREEEGNTIFGAYHTDSFTKEQLAEILDLCGEYHLIPNTVIDGCISFSLAKPILDLKELDLKESVGYVINNLDIYPTVYFKMSDLTPLELGYVMSSLVLDFKVNVITDVKGDLIEVTI